MIGNMRKRNKGRKRQRNRQKPSQWLWEQFLKQPEKNAQMDPGEKGWACCYCWKEGQLKLDCPQACKPPLAPCPVCKGPHWKRECPPRFRFQGSDSQDNWDQRCLGVPTQAPNLLTPEEPQVLIPGGPISQFSFGHQGNFLLLKAPGLLSSWSTTVMGLSGQAKYFSIIDLRDAF